MTTILSDSRVLSSFLEKGRTVAHYLEPHRGTYVYVFGGGPARVNGTQVPVLGAAKLAGKTSVSLPSDGDAEPLLADVLLE
jgi:redox-sensitive bicupin YhaK (pirin superfamily)